MKRIIAAVSFAALAAPAFAAEPGLPYERTQFDRGLLTEQAPAPASSAAGSTSAPTGKYRLDTGAWANDQNFIVSPR